MKKTDLDDFHGDFNDDGVARAWLWWFLSQAELFSHELKILLPSLPYNSKK